MYLHEDGRIEMLEKPWRIEVSEMVYRIAERAAYEAALSDYVRAWPTPSPVGGGYAMSWTYYRKPLGYLVPFARALRDGYWRFMMWLALTGFIDADLDGGIVTWRDFTLNVFRVRRERDRRWPRGWR